MDILGLDHVQIAAPRGSETAARGFFGELLGLPEIANPPVLRERGVWFKLGPRELHVGIEEPFSRAMKAHPALRVAPERTRCARGAAGRRRRDLDMGRRAARRAAVLHARPVGQSHRVPCCGR